MPFCPGCGVEYQGEPNFCQDCGSKLASVITPQMQRVEQKPEPKEIAKPEYVGEKILWKGHPHVKNLKKSQSNLYEITTERIRVTKGMLSKKVEEIDLTRVKDIKVTQSLGQRTLGIGDLMVITTDPSTPNIAFEDISNPNKVKELLRKAVRDEKTRQGVVFREEQ